MTPHRTRSMSAKLDAELDAELDAKEADDFKFIMGKILCQKDDSPLSKCFERSGISDISGVLTLTDQAIDRLKHVDAGVKPPINEPLRVGDQQLIRSFTACVDTRVNAGVKLPGDWQNMALRDDFNHHRQHEFRHCVLQIPIPRTLAPAGIQTNAQTRDRIFEFKNKGIKRDPASFTIMKDNKQWDAVHRNLIAQTSYQDVADVLDPKYVPSSAEDSGLFDEKQT